MHTIPAHMLTQACRSPSVQERWVVRARLLRSEVYAPLSPSWKLRCRPSVRNARRVEPPPTSLETQNDSTTKETKQTLPPTLADWACTFGMRRRHVSRWRQRSLENHKLLAELESTLGPLRHVSK